MDQIRQEIRREVHGGPAGAYASAVQQLLTECGAAVEASFIDLEVERPGGGRREAAYLRHAVR